MVMVVVKEYTSSVVAERKSSSVGPSLIIFLTLIPIDGSIGAHFMKDVI